ncbi:MAG: hypothetical protein F6K28_37820 [Microcoleus sp. SIO2G3]|nr:hypothetical protein [Microcoleus sp. SIO2G3]
MPAKSKNPDYHQLCVYVPKEMAVKFKARCVERGLGQSEVVTDFIDKWLKELE